MALAGLDCANDGMPLYWARQCISYSVVPRQSDTPSLVAIRDVVDRSFATWSDVQCNGHALGLGLSQTSELSQCDTPGYDEKGPNANSIIFLTDWRARDLPREAFGLTLVWHDEKTGEIFDADMQLNETLGMLDICKNASCADGTVDLQNIITHEAGHFLGLGHSSLTNACMYGKAKLGETSKRFLARDDEDGLCAIYGDLGTASCSADGYLPNGGFTSACPTNAPASAASSHGGGWLCSVGHAADGGALATLSALAAALTLAIRRRRSRTR